MQAPRTGWIIALCAIGSLIAALDTLVVASALSTIQADLGASLEQLEWTIDRLAYGAVFDFIHFHVGSFSWYVFNVADAAIVAGVIGLLYDSLVLEKHRNRKTRRAGA